jgi:hypothetical protein
VTRIEPEDTAARSGTSHLPWRLVRRRACCLGASAALFAAAGTARAEEPNELTREEVEARLDAEPGEVDVDAPEPELLPLPPPPRRHGVVIEGSVGALGHLGDMKYVSPAAPWFRLQAGYELFDWLMLFGEADVALSRTTHANRPPEPRTYALFGFGAGARFTWQALERVGFYLQGDLGLASVSEDVLSTYGYPDADRLRPYFGGFLGVDWYQVNPHYALSFNVGVRDYVETFERIAGERPPITWMSALALRYAL